MQIQPIKCANVMKSQNMFRDTRITMYGWTASCCLQIVAIEFIVDSVQRTLMTVP